MTSNGIVQKLWNYCNILRDDGLSYGDYPRLRGDRLEQRPHGKIQGSAKLRRLMDEAESLALQIAQDWAIEHFAPGHRFTAEDLCEFHRQWLGAIYPWAGEYRSVNIGKGEFQFAAAHLLPNLMAEFERGPLAKFTPCVPAPVSEVAHALAD